jgi:hypothetical protein
MKQILRDFLSSRCELFLFAKQWFAESRWPQLKPFRRTRSLVKISGRAFNPRPVCGILSALRVLAAYLIRA